MSYTEKLMKEIERVTLRGNADKETVRMLSSIIFDMEQRIKTLEASAKPTVTPVIQPEIEVDLEEKPEPKIAAKRVTKKSEDK